MTRRSWPRCKTHPNARVFGFGIGTSVNRFLLTRWRKKAMVMWICYRAGEAQAAADRFYERVHSPVLTNIAIDWHGLPVTDVYPKDVRDLFSAKPIIITGRYSGSPAGKITIKGYQGTGDYSRTIPVIFLLPTRATRRWKKSGRGIKWKT